MNTPKSLSRMVSDLVRRGLPSEYAQRAAAELVDHHRDLVEELQASGWSESQASTEASRRLGDPQTITKKTVREYQRRFWCARWPLITFLIAPIPTLVAAWFALAYSVYLFILLLSQFGLTTVHDADVAFGSTPVQAKYAVLASVFLVVPAVVMYGFGRLAIRAALSWQWFILAACLLGMFVGACKWERIGPGSRLVMTDWNTGKVVEQPKPDFVLTMWWPINAQQCSWRVMRPFFFSSFVQPCQLLIPFTIAGWFLYRRRQRMHAESLTLDYC
jgi:hypothetical protein